LRRSSVNAHRRKVSWRNFRKITASRSRSKNRRKALFFSHFHHQITIARAMPHLFTLPNDARHYTGRNGLSEGIFLATADSATRKLRLVVCCITAFRPK
jgi:hypothetical protein